MTTDRKSRIEEIVGRTIGDIEEISISITERGEIVFNTPMEAVHAVRSYNREKKPKILSRVPQPQNSVSLDVNRILLRDYDVICAVDTNTRTIESRQISVVGTSLVTNKMIGGRDGIRTAWHYSTPFCLEYGGLRPAPENFGWIGAAATLMRRDMIRAHDRVALVVDSDLGNIDSYNARTMPVVLDILLPEQITLVYATSDSGTECILNKAMWAADRAASLCLEAFASGKIDLSKPESMSPHFDSFRVVTSRAR